MIERGPKATPSTIAARRDVAVFRLSTDNSQSERLVHLTEGKTQTSLARLINEEAPAVRALKEREPEWPLRLVNGDSERSHTAGPVSFPRLTRSGVYYTNCATARPAAASAAAAVDTTTHPQHSQHGRHELSIGAFFSKAVDQFVVV